MSRRRELGLTKTAMKVLIAMVAEGGACEDDKERWILNPGAYDLACKQLVRDGFEPSQAGAALWLAAKCHGRPTG